MLIYFLVCGFFKRSLNNIIMNNICPSCGFIISDRQYNCPKCKALIDFRKVDNEPPVEEWAEDFNLRPSSRKLNKKLKKPKKIKKSGKSKTFRSNYNLVFLLSTLGLILIFYIFRGLLNKFPSPANTLLLIFMVGFMIYFSNHPEKIEVFIDYPYLVKRNKQYYRLLSSGFMHINFMHIFFNCLALYSFGGGVERLLRSLWPDFGSGIYLLIFLAGVMLSALPTAYKERDNINYISLGASGGVSLVLGLYLTYFPHTQVLLFFIPMQGGTFLVAYLVLSLVLAIKANASADRVLTLGGKNPIGHLTHFTGALVGVILAFLLLFFR